jgi:hypothetical protein
MKQTLGERIAVLETEMKTAQGTLANMGETQQQLLATQQEILLALTKNKGMWGGIVMTVSAVWAVFQLAKDSLVGLITKLFQ